LVEKGGRERKKVYSPAASPNISAKRNRKNRTMRRVIGPQKGGKSGKNKPKDSLVILVRKG